MGSGRYIRRYQPDTRNRRQSDTPGTQAAKTAAQATATGTGTRASVLPKYNANLPAGGRLQEFTFTPYNANAQQQKQSARVPMTIQYGAQAQAQTQPERRVPAYNLVQPTAEQQRQQVGLPATQPMDGRYPLPYERLQAQQQAAPYGLPTGGRLPGYNAAPQIQPQSIGYTGEMRAQRTTGPVPFSAMDISYKIPYTDYTRYSPGVSATGVIGNTLRDAIPAVGNAAEEARFRANYYKSLSNTRDKAKTTISGPGDPFYDAVERNRLNRGAPTVGPGQEVSALPTGGGGGGGGGYGGGGGGYGGGGGGGAYNQQSAPWWYGLVNWRL